MSDTEPIPATIESIERWAHHTIRLARRLLRERLGEHNLIMLRPRLDDIPPRRWYQLEGTSPIEAWTDAGPVSLDDELAGIVEEVYETVDASVRALGGAANCSFVWVHEEQRLYATPAAYCPEHSPDGPMSFCISTLPRHRRQPSGWMAPMDPQGTLPALCHPLSCERL